MKAIILRNPNSKRGKNRRGQIVTVTLSDGMDLIEVVIFVDSGGLAALLVLYDESTSCIRSRTGFQGPPSSESWNSVSSVYRRRPTKAPISFCGYVFSRLPTPRHDTRRHTTRKKRTIFFFSAKSHRSRCLLLSPLPATGVRRTIFVV